MYANLEVTISLNGDTPRTIYAFAVEVARGQVVVKEDLNDGDGSYAVAGPIHTFDLADVTMLAVGADF